MWHLIHSKYGITYYQLSTTTSVRYPLLNCILQRSIQYFVFILGKWAVWSVILYHLLGNCLYFEYLVDFTASTLQFLTFSGFSSLKLNSTRSRMFAVCTNNIIYEFQTTNLSSRPIATYQGHLASSFYIKAAISPDDRSENASFFFIFCYDLWFTSLSN